MSIAEIPTVDLDDLASDDATRRSRACADLVHGYGTYGLVFVAGHGIERPRVDSVYDDYLDVLERPEEEKRTWGGAHIWYQRGWTPPNTEKAVVAGGQPDFKECYFAAPGELDDDCKQFYPELYCDNVWPQDAERFRHGMLGLGNQIHDVGSALLEGCAEALDLPTDTFSQLTQGAASVTRILKYLALDQQQVDAKVLWGEEHTDFNLLTLLPGGRLHAPDGTPNAKPSGPGGLFLRTRPTQEHPNGQLIRGVTPPGCIVSQVGQQLEILTGGTFHATPHVVTAPNEPGWTRVSMAHFIHVNGKKPLFPLARFRTEQACQDYRPPVLAGNYGVKTLIDIGLAPRASWTDSGTVTTDASPPSASVSERRVDGWSVARSRRGTNTVRVVDGGVGREIRGQESEIRAASPRNKPGAKRLI